MSFQQGLSGLSAASKQLEVIGNNVANANTAGFKAANAIFADVFSQAGGGSASTAVGIGTSVAAVLQNFSQGNISVTNNPLDLAINGNGFFRMDNNGVVTYGRGGQFSLDKDGYIVNGSGQKLTGFGVNSNNQIVQSTPSPLRISSSDIAPKVTDGINVNVNLSSQAAVINPVTTPFDINNGSTYTNSTSLSVYDAVGNQHTLSLYFARRSSTTWDVYGALDGAQIQNAAIRQLTFNASGQLTAGGAGPFTIPITNPDTGAALGNPVLTGPIALTTDPTGQGLGNGLVFAESTQYGTPYSVNALSQTGYTAGRLSGFSVSTDGTILGRYSNGQSRPQGQVVLANFTNPNGLRQLGNNQWSESSDSGPALVGAPGSGSLGSLQSGAIEEANIDLTAQLVDMITAQRVYQANAQTIKTQDQVLQTLVNLR
ncbi:flagellar hook protein FlgE [Parvibium lacunae]|uniref:Flagellar hook protein FlgE n=1 Tax=Parvibium lacunae TaxID=1888893 RepID=A0A368L3N4_9BURK|nr:flagellar hook protein FlgE [Parvibium lacunae]RCS58198.1 flagellar hook protein FlgE [Parvibium lacunae]